MKKIIATIIFVSIAFMLCACNSNKGQQSIEGTWKGSWSYNGNYVETTVTFYSDGRYSKTGFINGRYNSGATGTWKMDGSIIRCYPDGTVGVSMDFEYNGKQLTNNDHIFEKEE